LRVFFSGDGRSSDSDEIVLIVVAVDVVVVIVVVVVENMIIAVAVAKADELPFNFSTSLRTCICSVRLTASSSEYPFTLKTLGILLPTGRIWVTLTCHKKERGRLGASICSILPLP
jgi:hypothetical protein